MGITERPSPMIRPATIFLLAAGVTLAAPPAFAQTAVNAPHHARKLPKPKKTAAPAAPMSGGINTPSTDFSKIDRADDDASDHAGGANSVRPVMGESGNIGLGTGF